MHPRWYRSVYTRAHLVKNLAQRPPESRDSYERRVEWMHQAKYGAMFHFLANIGTLPRLHWTSESWNAAVDAVDVEAFADQCADAGLGYVILTLGQNCRYA